MIYKKRYGQPFDTESVVGSFLPMMETIPYLTKEPDGFSYAMEPQVTFWFARRVTVRKQ